MVVVLIMCGVFSGSVFGQFRFQGFSEAVQHGGDLFGFGDEGFEVCLLYDADTPSDVKLGA
jgi:hypothetical protein